MQMNMQRIGSFGQWNFGKKSNMRYYDLENKNIDLTQAISRHSADRLVCYSMVNGEAVYLGYFLPDTFVHTCKYPTFIMIHGGGWSQKKIFEDQSCWAGDYLGYLARYYAKKGVVAISIDYRLIRERGQAKDYGLLDCCRDCSNAMDYIVDHAEEFSVDLQNMYLLGESAGGYLAAAMVTFQRSSFYSFKKVILVNAITDLRDEKWSWVVQADKARHQNLQEISPVCQLNENICEVILIHGEKDTTVDLQQSLNFYQCMQNLDKSCSLHIIKETKHAFLLAEYYPNIIACYVAISIIDKCL